MSGNQRRGSAAININKSKKKHLKYKIACWSLHDAQKRNAYDINKKIKRCFEEMTMSLLQVIMHGSSSYEEIKCALRLAKKKIKKILLFF